MSMGKRTYQQRQRAQMAETTRQRILEAARACLTATPLLAVSLERIAQRAGVARRTIYQIFGSRVGLFEALEQDLLQRGGFAEVQAAFNDNTDARRILEQMLPASTQLLEREQAVLRALYLQALIDPAAASLTQRIDEGRIGGMRYLAHLLEEQGYIRPDLSLAEIGDLLALLTDFATFDQLRSRLGASPEEIVRRLHILASGLLVDRRA
jgi:AcrR family transcriptional regulator